MNQKIAIFGGSGFIGFNLSNILRKRKCKVFIFDIVKPDILHENQTYKYFDIRDIQNNYAFLSSFDYAYVLSALLGKGCALEPENGLRTNILGTCHLISSISNLKSKPIVVFSSSAMVYDNFDNRVPILETRSMNADTIYDHSKIIGESHLYSCNCVYGLKAIVLRFFTVYGPGPASASKGHFIPIWIEQAKEHNELLVYDDGQQTIDLTHVFDIAEAMASVIERDKESVNFEIINVASGHETKVCEVADWFLEVKPGLKIKYLPEKKVSPKRKCGNIKKAKDYLNFTPKIQPKQGISQLLAQKL